MADNIEALRAVLGRDYRSDDGGRTWSDSLEQDLAMAGFFSTRDDWYDLSDVTAITPGFGRPILLYACAVR